jgi:hypothetical protein
MPQQYNNVLLFDRMATRTQEELDDTRSQRIFSQVFKTLNDGLIFHTLDVQNVVSKVDGDQRICLHTQYDPWPRQQYFLHASKEGHIYA